MGRVERRLRRGRRLGGGPLFGGQWSRNGLAPCMWSMEEGRRVLRPKRMRPRRQKARRCITGGWHPLAGERRQGRRHACIPGGVSARPSALFQTKKGTHGLRSPQAKTASTGVVLGQGHGFAGHGLGQSGGFRLAGGADRCFTRAVDRRLRPRGSGHTSVQAGEGEEETDQAQATRPDFATHQREGQHEPMQAGEARAIVAKLRHRRAALKGIVPPAPGLQRALRGPCSSLAA
jgi:hypothetical protein